MREGWEIKTLGEVCDVFDRKRKPISKRDREPGPYPYYGASCIQDYVAGYLFDGRYLLIGEDGAKWGPGDDTAFIVEGKFWVNNHAHIVKAKDGFLDDYICYYIKSLDLNPIVAGAIIPKLTQEKLTALEIPFPSLPEQQRIVDILDLEFAKIDGLKVNAEKSLQAAKDLFQATLKRELEPKEGWRKMILNEICNITADLIDPTLPEYINQIHIGGANIVAETGVLIDLKTSREEKLISGKFPFDETMVLYSKIRPYLKKVCCPDFQGICSADIYPLKPFQGVDRTFLYYILLSQDFTDYAILGSARAGMPKVNRPYMFAYSCSIPEYKEQRRVANKLDVVREQTYALQENYKKTLTLCDAFKQALLRKAFNGEL